jgi:hypothetical protein
MGEEQGTNCGSTYTTGLVFAKPRGAELRNVIKRLLL